MLLVLAHEIADRVAKEHVHLASRLQSINNALSAPEDKGTLARIAGHSSTKMSERYVHPSSDAVFSAFSRMPRQKAVVLATSDEPKGEAPEMEISM
jgi:hypothetical protein